MLHGAFIIMLPAMSSVTPEQIQVLFTASEFAAQIWESRTASCQMFLRSYPLD